MQRAVKVELHPNNVQKTRLRQFCGTARFAWNWGLAQRKRAYRDSTGKDRHMDAMKQHKELNKLKQGEFNWMYSVSKCVPQEALRDLDKAFKNFFRNRKNDTLLELLDFHGEDSKAIIWAHNTHIGDARTTDMKSRGKFNIGQLARQEFGAEHVALVGFLGYHGRLWQERTGVLRKKL